MTCAVASACLAGGKVEDFAHAFHDFYAEYPEAGYGYNFSRWARARSFSQGSSWGNGTGIYLFINLFTTPSTRRRATATTFRVGRGRAASRREALGETVRASLSIYSITLFD